MELTSLKQHIKYVVQAVWHVKGGGKIANYQHDTWQTFANQEKGSGNSCAMHSPARLPKPKRK